MNIALPPELEGYIASLMSFGGYSKSDDVVVEALREHQTHRRGVKVVATPELERLLDEGLEELESAKTTNELQRGRMNEAKFSPRAERDLDEIFNHTSANEPDAEYKVREIILATADFFVQRPEVGRHILKAALSHLHIRWLIVPRFGDYIIFYQPFQTGVMVIRVLHPSRDWTSLF